MDPGPVERSRQDDQTLLAANVWATEIGAYEWDITTDRVRWLNDWCQHQDIDPCDGDNHAVRWRALVHPDDRAPALALFEAHLAGLRDRYESEYRVRTRGGEWRWIRNRAYVLRGPGPADPVRLMGLCLDINERRELEHELERSRSNLEALAAAAPIWMMLLDADGKIEFANRSMRGISPQALIGRTIASVINDPGEAAALEAFRITVLRTRLPQMHTTVLRDGRSIGTWATPTLRDGKVTGIASVSVDLSERRTRERDLLEAVTREQRRFWHDLHDGLGQELTGIALLVKTLVKRAERDAPDLCEGLNEVLNYVTGAIATSREVARGASPVGREHGGLGRALAELAGHWPTDGELEIACRVDPTAGESLEPLIAENIYRIAQESISNAVRHSGARRVELTLEQLTSGAAIGVRLIVEDDGGGIRASEILVEGLGLKIMRARAELIGAVLMISGRAPQGTRVECLCDGRGAGAARER